MQKYTELRVWQFAHQLVLDVYKVSAAFPREERFALTNQIRRAAASVPTNIVEGSKRTPKEFARFLNIAEGSAAETGYLLLLAEDLAFVAPTQTTPLRTDCATIERMLHGLRESVLT